MPQIEYVGRYRRAGGSVALFIPAELRKKLQWPIGQYVLMVVHDGLLMMRPVHQSMLLQKDRPISHNPAPAAGAKG